MTGGSLRDSIRRRLDYLRTGSTGSPSKAASSVPDERCPEELGGDWQRVASYVYRRVSIVPSPLSKRPRLLPASIPIERCGFFDTETTGRSGGAGTVIFLFGIASVRGNRMVVEQVFLEDFSGETAFLEHLEQLLADYGIFVSFNGKSFDTTILNTRFLMGGKSLNMPEHLDLLYPSRRLWASVATDCRLKTLEEEILGIDRGEDIDGSEVPDIYFDFLRSGETGRLSIVFEHNRSDIVTLAHLLETIEQALSGEAAVPVDLGGVGHLLLARDDRRGLEYLRQGYVGGQLTCGTALGSELKKVGAWGEAVELWRDMANRYRDAEAAVELSKYYEHRLKDYDAALDCVKQFFGDVQAIDDDLLRRVARLRRKRAAAGKRRAPVQ